jgi:hypothetical protein
VKHIEPGGYLGSIEMKGKIVHQIESPKQNNEVEDTIRNGIKETNWRTVDNFPEFEQRVIQNGIKETWGYERQPQQRIDHVIEQGIKENPSL